MSKDSKIVFCPNCGQSAIQEGNEITCEKCDAKFTITKKDGARVKELGRIERIEQDVAELQAAVKPEPAAEPEPEPVQDEDQEPEPEPAAGGDESEEWP